jgi:dTDP-4-amino-4,6-dideoxygalactose transaminase
LTNLRIITLLCVPQKEICEESMEVRMRDLSIKDLDTQQALHLALQEALDDGQFILGDRVEMFEKKIQEMLGVSYAVSCSSASSGLYLALKALNIGPGDEVITTPLTWLVTGSAILQVGATPVFVDVDDNYNISPSAIRSAISKKTKSILAVHYYGRMANIKEIAEIALNSNVSLIEDCAQAFGAMRDNLFAGLYGDVGVYSFSPMKVIGGLGDNGMIVCKSSEIAERIKILRHAGTVNKEWCVSPEGNHLMDSLHASFLTVIVERTNEIISKRRDLALLYEEALREFVMVPSLGVQIEHTAYDYPIRVKNRNSLNDFLNSLGIESRIRHPYLVSDQPIHHNSVVHELKYARLYVDEILCLPIHNNLSEFHIDFVSDAIKTWIKKH